MNTKKPSYNRVDEIPDQRIHRFLQMTKAIGTSLAIGALTVALIQNGKVLDVLDRGVFVSKDEKK